MKEFTSERLYDLLSGFAVELENELQVMFHRCDFLVRRVKPDAIRETKAALNDPLFQAGLTASGYLPAVDQTAVNDILPAIDEYIGAYSNHDNLASVPLNVARWSLLTLRAELIGKRFKKAQRLVYFIEGLTSAYDLEKPDDFNELYAYFCAALNPFKDAQAKDYPVYFARFLAYFGIEPTSAVKSLIIHNGGTVESISEAALTGE